LALESPTDQSTAKLAILVASVLAALGASLLLTTSGRRADASVESVSYIG
jgi:hypothetical protein